MISRARLSRVLSATLGWLASHSQRAGFFAADLLAMVWVITGRHPNRKDLRALGIDRPGAVRNIWHTHARSLLLSGWVRRDRREPLRRLVQNHALVRELRPPMILGTFHIGATLGLGVLSEQLQGETLVLRGSQFPLDPTARGDVDLIAGSDQQRAATFHRAIERLRQNGFVILALDPKEAQRIAVPFFGGTLQLARGPFAMARIARAPIVPVVARWNGDAIELIFGDALPMSGDEAMLAASAAQWLEQYLRESPGELSYRVLELMERAPLSSRA